MSFKRWTLSRRLVQLAAIGLIASPLAGLTIFQGTLAAADLFGLPLADPLAALQVVLATGLLVPAFLGSAIGVTLFYFLLGGRTFCSWVCPVYLLTELADKLRLRLGTGERILPLATKNWLLLSIFLITGVTGLPLFEIMSPIGMTGRAIAVGGWLALVCLVGLLVIEVVLARRLWCRSLCPLGGFYALVGRLAPLRLRFHQVRCTACGECSRVCPVAEVLAPSLERGTAQIHSGDCTRCACCIDCCPTNALTIGFGYSDQGGRR
jgi:ferredoxin-type protein NapH